MPINVLSQMDKASLCQASQQVTSLSAVKMKMSVVALITNLVPAMQKSTPKKPIKHKDTSTKNPIGQMVFTKDTLGWELSVAQICDLWGTRAITCIFT